MPLAARSWSASAPWDVLIAAPVFASPSRQSSRSAQQTAERTVRHRATCPPSRRERRSRRAPRARVAGVNRDEDAGERRTKRTRDETTRLGLGVDREALLVRLHRHVVLLDQELDIALLRPCLDVLVVELESLLARALRAGEVAHLRRAHRRAARRERRQRRRNARRRRSVRGSAHRERRRDILRERRSTHESRPPPGCVDSTSNSQKRFGAHCDPRTAAHTQPPRLGRRTLESVAARLFWYAGFFGSRLIASSYSWIACGRRGAGAHAPVR